MLSFTLMFTCASPVLADSAWPNRTVKIVVGYAPGGATDVIARLIAKELSTATGQPFIVENRPGANSNIGAEAVARSKPDGYTVLVGTISSTINEAMYKNLSFKLMRDFVPVALFATVPNVLVVPPSFPMRSVKEYIDYAKANPGKVTFASAGSGSSIHLSGELFKIRANVSMVHVPYRGSGPAMTDLLGGQVMSMFDNLPSAAQYIQAGRLKALAVTSRDRVPSLPDVPTISESGLPDFDMYSWFGLMAPAGTPKEIVNKLNEGVAKALKEPSVVAQLAKLGAMPKSLSPAEFDTFMRSEITKWAAVVAQSGATVD